MKKIAVSLKEKPKSYDGLWLSVSKKKTFEDCKAKFRFNYILKLPKKTWSFHVLGSFAHRVLELFHLERLNGNNSPDNKLMGKVFNQAAKEDDFKGKLQKDDKQLVYEMCLKYLSILKEQRENGNEPEILNVESKFYIDIFGEILLNGMIDLEKMDPDGVLHLADYKTSKSMRYLKNDFFQLLVYAYVKCIENPDLERVRCSYIMLRHDFKYITKEFLREDVMKIQDELLEYAEDIKKEKLFRPKPTRLCEYCDFLESCPEGSDYLGVKHNVSKYGAQQW